MTIVCNLEIYYSDRHTEGKKQRIEFKVEETPGVGDDLREKLLFNPELSDITLICGEKRFPCHRAMLASRSDVFAAMFKHMDPQEAAKKEIHLKDTEPEVMEQLLQFLYTDHCSDLLASAGSLLTEADKYNIPRLKATCEEAMCDNIDVGNAAKVLILAYLHEAKNLQTVAVDFVTDNMVKVSETPGWKIITESHPRIMNEILMSLTAKMRR